MKQTRKLNAIRIEGIWLRWYIRMRMLLLVSIDSIMNPMIFTTIRMIYIRLLFALVIYVTQENDTRLHSVRFTAQFHINMKFPELRYLWKKGTFVTSICDSTRDHVVPSKVSQYDNHIQTNCKQFAYGWNRYISKIIRYEQHCLWNAFAMLSQVNKKNCTFSLSNNMVDERNWNIKCRAVFSWTVFLLEHFGGKSKMFAHRMFQATR